ncbi:DUF2971 domain-containing protein [Enterobacter asburiae]|uniref:DUF2971 domain-containing protein n=1 Tax=Enterobacter asburiae TaxID=61645 RepID=UPI002DBB1B50|nr:DUF2971 domain-containing protein [Enterobacter asburiae]MEB7279657.1 DUF2971 domain-containing protein [Enterobacter asburiae]
MGIPFPFFYKFSALNINSLSALAEGKAWFSRLADFNDPFEGQFLIKRPDIELDKEKLFQYMGNILPKNVLSEPASEIIRRNYEQSPDGFKKTIEQAVSTTYNRFHNAFQNISAFCLASDIPNVDASHVSNVMMWSHYADGMKGFCIKFKPEYLLSSLREMNEPNFNIAQVHYQDEMYNVDFFDLVDLSKNVYTQAIHTKHTGWEYECECRIITENPGLYKYSHDAIDCIFIGSKMPLPHQKILLDICSVNIPNVNIYSVRTHASGYAVELGKYQKVTK